MEEETEIQWALRMIEMEYESLGQYLAELDGKISNKQYSKKRLDTMLGILHDWFIALLEHMKKSFEHLLEEEEEDFKYKFIANEQITRLTFEFMYEKIKLRK